MGKRRRRLLLCLLLLLLEGILQVLGSGEVLDEFEAFEEIVASAQTHAVDVLAGLVELVSGLGCPEQVITSLSLECDVIRLRTIVRWCFDRHFDLG